MMFAERFKWFEVFHLVLTFVDVAQVVVLYVDEATSIQRQLQRAVAARAHNARVKDAGVSEQARLQEERPTDLDLNKATKRYQIFKQHYSAILRLKQFLPFHLIDAMGSKQDTQEQITQVGSSVVNQPI
jgi:hypothetical protein